MPDQFSGVDTAGDVTAIPQALLDVYSTDILHDAMGVMMYENFAVRKTELSKAPGERVMFTRYSDIEGGGELNEQDSIETEDMAASQFGITVTEYGHGLAITEKLLQLSFDDMMAEMALLLSRNYARVRDTAIRDAVNGGGSVLFTNSSASSNVDVTGSDTFDIETLRVAREQFATNNVPKFQNDYYVCFVHPHQAAYLRRDPDWVSAHEYFGDRNLFTGELGRWEDIIFVQSTYQNNGAAGTSEVGYDASLDGSGAASIDLYQGTLIGDQAYGVADALPVEMRSDGVNDFGRKHKLAWYGIWGQGVLNDDHIVHIVSA